MQCHSCGAENPEFLAIGGPQELPLCGDCARRLKRLIEMKGWQIIDQRDRG